MHVTRLFSSKTRLSIVIYFWLNMAPLMRQSITPSHKRFVISPDSHLLVRNQIVSDTTSVSQRTRKLNPFANAIKRWSWRRHATVWRQVAISNGSSTHFLPTVRISHPLLLFEKTFWKNWMSLGSSNLKTNWRNSKFLWLCIAAVDGWLNIEPEIIRIRFLMDSRPR